MVTTLPRAIRSLLVCNDRLRCELEGDSMRGMLAQLSPHEETALRKIAAGSDEPTDPVRIRRLAQLELIEWNGRQWLLTDLGHSRYAALMTSSEAADSSAG
jgi:hypothetical protein